jgi:hypothetical protein
MRSHHNQDADEQGSKNHPRNPDPTRWYVFCLRGWLWIHASACFHPVFPPPETILLLYL